MSGPAVDARQPFRGLLLAWTAAWRAARCRDAGLTGAARPLVLELAADDRDHWRAALAAEPTFTRVGETSRLAGPFDLVCCAFVLAGADDPPALRREMRRLAGPNGRVAALAEADWGALRDPANPGLADLLSVALAARGVDPLAGNKLADWFAAGGRRAECGAIDFAPPSDQGAVDAWWAEQRAVLAGFVGERKLNVFERKDRRAAAAGERAVRLPLAWAVERV